MNQEEYDHSYELGYGPTRVRCTLSILGSPRITLHRVKPNAPTVGISWDIATVKTPNLGNNSAKLPAPPMRILMINPNIRATTDISNNDLGMACQTEFLNNKFRATRLL